MIKGHAEIEIISTFIYFSGFEILKVKQPVFFRYAIIIING